jgi:hypothetical protein
MGSVTYGGFYDDSSNLFELPWNTNAINNSFNFHLVTNLVKLAQYITPIGLFYKEVGGFTILWWVFVFLNFDLLTKFIS